MKNVNRNSEYQRERRRKYSTDKQKLAVEYNSKLEKFKASPLDQESVIEIHTWYANELKNIKVNEFSEKLNNPFVRHSKEDSLEFEVSIEEKK